MKHMKNKRMINWILLIIWMVIIFEFSSQTGAVSGDLSNSLLYRLLGIFIKDLSDINPDILKTLMFLIRKLAHFSEYAILSVLMLNVLKSYYDFSFKLGLLALVLCALYAASDEFHQLFIPGRAGSLKDVLIDTSGSAFSLLIYGLYLKWSKGKLLS